MAYTEKFLDDFCNLLMTHRHALEPDRYPQTWTEFKLQYPDRVDRFRADAKFGLDVLVPFVEQNKMTGY